MHTLNKFLVHFAAVIWCPILVVVEGINSEKKLKFQATMNDTGPFWLEHSNMKKVDKSQPYSKRGPPFLVPGSPEKDDWSIFIELQKLPLITPSKYFSNK